MKYLKNTSSLSFNSALCTGCGLCKAVCPHGVFTIEHKKAKLTDLDACMECGACQMNCSAGAIKVIPGVGCAWAIFSAMLGKNSACCASAQKCC